MHVSFLGEGDSKGERDRKVGMDSKVNMCNFLWDLQIYICSSSMHSLLSPNP